MKLQKCFAADFETTTDENDCRVWAYALCNIDDYTRFEYGNSLDEFFKFCAEPKTNYKIWFHNLKFDGSFMIYWLESSGFTHIKDRKDKRDKTYTTLITDMGQFYSIVIYFKVKGHHINKVEIYDSLKILNFSVERVAEGFNLPIRKLKIDYNEYREVGHRLTKEEVDYIRNDVEIMARALKEMFMRGLTRMTIAGDAMNNFKDHFVGFRKKFPLLPPDVDADIRKSYRGGFTYVNDEWKEKEVSKGIILDVNSLYSSCMSTPYFLPYSQPQLFEGEYQEDKLYPLYVQSITCSFELKEGKIPTIQIKNSLSFIANEYVKSSNGEMVTLYLTSVDLELFKKHYNIYNETYNGGWKFKAAVGMFDEYIQYWTEQKIEAGKQGSKPQRQIAKLMLNSLCGRFAQSSNAMVKVPYIDDEGVIRFNVEEEKPRETVYVAVASFITAYGRKRTIETSQIIKDYTKKKYGKDLYYYSDTDSIHCSLTDEDLEELKDIIKVDPYELGCWDKEAEFEKGLYIRQKCYIEMINGRTNVTVAGLPKYLAPLITFDNFKKGFSTEGLTQVEMVSLASKNGATPEEIEKIHHKFRYKYVKGGVILADTDFTIK